jgi:hypothetical protein
MSQIINEVLGLAPPSNDLNQDGTVNAVDTQIVIDGVVFNVCIVK